MVWWANVVGDTIGIPPEVRFIRATCFFSVRLSTIINHKYGTERFNNRDSLSSRWWVWPFWRPAPQFLISSHRWLWREKGSVIWLSLRLSAATSSTSQWGESIILSRVCLSSLSFMSILRRYHAINSVYFCTKTWAGVTQPKLVPH